MYKFFKVLVPIVLLVLCFSTAALAFTSEPFDSVCRVKCGNGIGSGSVFEISQSSVFILTNAHVVSDVNVVTCEFWKSGHQSVPLSAKVVLRATDIDAAVVAIPQSSFCGNLPKITQVAPRNYTLMDGELITSAGCSQGAWATYFAGHVTGRLGNMFSFIPRPEQGRSGSAVLNREGKIVGILRAQSGNNEEPAGYAVSVQDIYKALGRETAIVLAQKCPPGGCGPNGCPVPGYNPPRQPRVLPYRREIEPRLNPVFPTLPAPEVTPVAPKPEVPPVVTTPQVMDIPVKKAEANPAILAVLVVLGVVVGFVFYFLVKPEK